MKQRAKYYTNKDIVSDPNLLQSCLEVPSIGTGLIEQIEWALMFLSFDFSMLGIFEYEKSFHMREFDGAWLLGQDRISKPGDTGLKFFTTKYAQATPDIFPDLHVKVFHLKTDENTSYGLESFKLIPPKEKRHLPPSYRHVMRYRTALLAKNEKWYLSESHFRLDDLSMFDYIKKVFGNSADERFKQIVSGKFFPIDISFDPRYRIDEKQHVLHYFKSTEGIDAMFDLVDRINYSFNIKLTGYYEWFVYIRETDKSIGFKIPINPAASKEVFKLRDTPEGKERRKAICNFVCEHLRNTGRDAVTDEHIKTVVKQHLRGEAKFNWRGLQVNIIPSEYDIKRIKSSKKFLDV